MLCRLVLRVGALLLVGGLWIGAAAPASAQSPVITNAPSLVAASVDYASDVLSDPWDFSNINDLGPYPYEILGWTISTPALTQGRSAFLSGGQFVARTSPGGGNTIPMLFRGGVDLVQSVTETTGRFDHQAIPTARYGKLAIKMTLSASTGGSLAAFWFADPYGPSERARGVGFKTPQSGTHLYIVDLVTGVWFDARGNPASGSFFPLGGRPQIAWDGTPLMRGFQLRPISDGNAQVDVQIDWVRLTQRDNTASVSTLPLGFTGCASRPYNVEVEIAPGVWEIIHTGTAGSGTTTAQVNYGVLPPASWRFRVTCYPTSRAPNGGAGVSSSPVTIAINFPPAVGALSPDASGGADWATDALNNPWDMNALSDMAQIFSVTNPHIVFDGIANALQGGSPQGAHPAIVFLQGAQPQRIDPRRYRNVTFSVALDTPFCLDVSLDCGSLARVIWERPSGGNHLISISQDILMWPGRNTYTIDLSTLTMENGGLEVECFPGCTNTPWSAAGEPIRYFRIDPHEAFNSPTFRLGPVYLTAPDAVALGTTFPIQFAFSDADMSGSTYQAVVYLDTDRNADAKTQLDIIDGVSPNAVQTYAFNPSAKSVPPGEYFVYVEIRETRGSFTDVRGIYASGPLAVVTATTGPTPPGPPTLNPVQVSSNPVSIAWSPGPGGAPTSYTVVAGTSPGASNLGVFPVGTMTSVSGNIPPGVVIYARVIASNEAGSAASNEITLFVSPPGVPAAPTMNSPSVSGRTVALSWNPSPSGSPPTHFVLIGRFQGNPTIIATAPVAGTSVSIPGVPPGSYVVTVVAVNAAGVSSESNAVSVTVH